MNSQFQSSLVLFKSLKVNMIRLISDTDHEQVDQFVCDFDDFGHSSQDIQKYTVCCTVLKLNVIDLILVLKMTELSHVQVLNGPVTVASLVNGMIGGLLWVLPVMALNAGYMLTLMIILLTGVFSFYSCHLCIIHLGDQSDLDKSIYRHFNCNRPIKIFYDFIIWVNLCLIDILYFTLIVLQWDGLIYNQPNVDDSHNSDRLSILIPILNAVILYLATITLKYFSFGANILGYGIISIAAYLIFLIWALINQDINFPDSISVPVFCNKGGLILAAAMGEAFSIQQFCIPVLKKNKNTSKYVRYALYAYVLGGSAYLYVAFMGSFGTNRYYLGISGRTPTPGLANLTIMDYFGSKSIELKIIEAIYLIHLYSVFPEFIIISKKRFFAIFNIPESQGKHVSGFQALYFAIIIIIFLLVNIFKGDQLDGIIGLNGAVIGFFFIYTIPAILHIKCVYFSRGKKHYAPNNQIQIVLESSKLTPLQIPTLLSKSNTQKNLKKPFIPQDQYFVDIKKKASEIEQEISKNASEVIEYSKRNQNNDEIELNVKDNTFQVIPNDIDSSFYYCGVVKPSKNQQIFDLIMIGLLVLIGAYILGDGIYQYVQPVQPAPPNPSTEC